MQKKSFTLGLGSLVCLVLIFVGCSESPSDPEPTDKIIITNIPQQIGSNSKDSYKIYVSLSDSQNPSDPHKAQGTELLNGSFDSVTVKLYNPPPPDPNNPHPDPDLHGDPWSGTAQYFSVTISPQTVSSVDDINARPGLTFNKSKERISWEELLQPDLISPPQRQAIYEWIICKDDVITHP
jgi:hypothetical protein